MNAPRTRNEIRTSITEDLSYILDGGSIGKDDYRRLDDLATALEELSRDIADARERRGR